MESISSKAPMENRVRLNLSPYRDLTTLKNTLLPENVWAQQNNHTSESPCFSDLNKFASVNSNIGINKLNDGHTKSNESMNTSRNLINERTTRKIATATRKLKMNKSTNNINTDAGLIATRAAELNSRYQHDIMSDAARHQRLESMRLEEERMHKEIETEAEFARSEEGRELAKQRKLEKQKREEKVRRKLQEEEEEQEKKRIEKTLNERMWLETINWKCSLDSPTTAARGGNFHNLL